MSIQNCCTVKQPLFLDVAKSGNLVPFILGKKVKIKRVEQNFKLLSEHVFSYFNQGKLFLFDPYAGFDQCHLTSLKLAEIYGKYVENGNGISAETITAEDARFLILCFICSQCFRHSMKPLKALLNGSKQAGIFESIINVCKKPAQIALGSVMKEYITESIEQINDNKELHSLLQEKSLGTGRNGIFRYPKFAGVVLFNEKNKQLNIPIVFKIKVYSKTGFHVHAFVMNTSNNNKTQKQPAIVFEGMAYKGKAHPFDEYINSRDACPQGFLSPPTTTEHKGCCHCTPCSDEESSHEDVDFEAVKESSSLDEILCAEGADYSRLEQQDDVTKFFEDKEKYPQLHELYHKFSKFAVKSGLSMENTSAFVIEHAYPDTLDKATEKQRMLDTPVLQMLKNRGMIQ